MEKSSSTEAVDGPVSKIEILEDLGDIRTSKVAFKCPKKWDDLDQLTNVTRHCSAFEQTVFLCKADS